MSILASLLLLQAAPAVEPVPGPGASQTEQVSEEIVVIGRRLVNWRGNWKVRKGVVVCKTTRSTGDREIDAIGCRALTECVTPLLPRMKAISEMELSKREKTRRLNEAGQPIGPCITEKRNVAIDALASKRAGQS